MPRPDLPGREDVLPLAVVFNAIRTTVAAINPRRGCNFLFARVLCGAIWPMLLVPSVGGPFCNFHNHFLRAIFFYITTSSQVVLSGTISRE